MPVFRETLTAEEQRRQRGFTQVELDERISEELHDPRRGQLALEEPNENPNLLFELFAAPFRGVEGAAQSVWNLADFLVLDNLPNWDRRFLGKSQTFAGRAVEGVAQFLTGFFPVFGALGKVGQLGTTARSVAAGAAGDFFAFDAQEERLSNLIQEVPALQNPVTEFLAADEDDNQVVGRLKNAVEGLGLGALGDGLIRGLRGVKAMRKARAEGQPLEEAVKRNVEAFGTPEEIQKMLDARPDPKPAQDPTAAEPPPRKKVSLKDPDVSGRIEAAAAKNPVNFTTDDLLGIGSPEEMHELIRKQGERLAKEAPSALKDEKLLNETARQMEMLTGRDFEAVLSDFRRAASQESQAIFDGIALARTMRTTGDRTLEAVRLANESGNDLDRAKAVELAKRFKELMGLNFFGLRKQSGRILRSRRFVQAAEFESRETLRQIMEEAGGTDYLRNEFAKLGLAEDAFKLAKEVRARMTVGERLLRVYNEYWINSILSGPTTQAVNLLGNTLTTLYLPVERALGAALNFDTTGIMSAGKQIQYVVESIGESLKYAKLAWNTQQNILDPEGRVSDIIRKRAIGPENLGEVSGKFQAGTALGDGIARLGDIINTPSRGLLAGDEFFKQINARAAAKAKLWDIGVRKYGLQGEALDEFVGSSIQKTIREGGRLFNEASITREAIEKADSRGLTGARRNKWVSAYVSRNFRQSKSRLEDVHQAADFAALISREATFTEDIESQLGQWVQQGVARSPILQLVIPFVRTPANLLKFVGRRAFPTVRVPLTDTEIPLLRAVWKRQQDDLLSGDPLRQAAANGRWGVASLFFGGAFLAAINGRITGGGPRDPDERKILQETGWQPYSMKFGDQWVSFRRLDPFASFLGIMADFHELVLRDEERLREPLATHMASMISAMTRNVTNKSYLAGLSQILEALNSPERRAQTFLESRAASHVPNLFAQAKLAVGQDEVFREYQTFWDRTVAAIPGASKTLEPRRNLLGEKVTVKMILTPITKAQSWVNPITFTTNQNDPVFNELATMSHGFENPRPILYDRVDLLQITNKKGQTAYDRWQELQGEVKIGGQSLRDSLQKLFESRAYSRLSDVPEEPGFKSPKIRETRRVISLYRREALNQLRRELPEVDRQLSVHKLIATARRQGRTREQIESLIDLVR